MGQTTFSTRDTGGSESVSLLMYQDLSLRCSICGCKIMPIIRTGPSLTFYAHVPKCGGSSMAQYLTERFGPIAFHNPYFLSLKPESRWSKSSPQHIDVTSLHRLFPKDFFDHTFTFVRHPVGRIISAYHFQVEVERSVSEAVSFIDWLDEIEDRLVETPFIFDNHIRPMTDIVPEGAQVFYMEHGMDAVIPWLDEVVGEKTGPRALPRVNERKKPSKKDAAPIVPDDAILDRIARIYAADFERFGYSIAEKMPAAPAPDLPEDVIAARDAAQKAHGKPGRQFKRKVQALFGK